VVNKFNHNGTHFDSPHAILGFITYLLMLINAAVGSTAFFLPGLWGGEAKAKRLYKYHRIAGYTIFILALSTIAAATKTDYSKGVLHIPLSAVVAASVLTLLGLLPRIKKQKLGLH
jgi:hypothetical protein